MNNFEFSEGFKKRTLGFALRIIKLYKSLALNTECQVIGEHLLRSGTSLAANYPSACRARSKAEFLSKTSIVVEEADESIFWMELLLASEIIHAKKLGPLLAEAKEILSIVSKAKKTTKQPTP